ncbi:hypothetical protein C0J52_27440 [Blattella germanica]|nr:hypothetical protein C0J52_27440 [Blattella germanica]
MNVPDLPFGGMKHHPARSLLRCQPFFKIEDTAQIRRRKTFCNKFPNITEVESSRSECSGGGSMFCRRRLCFLPHRLPTTAAQKWATTAGALISSAHSPPQYTLFAHFDRINSQFFPHFKHTKHNYQTKKQKLHFST